MISHGQQRNEEHDAPSSELRYISGPGIDGLGNLNECPRWCRYVPLSLAVSPCSFSLIFGVNHHFGKNRDRTMESAVLPMRLPKWGSRPPHYPSILRFFGRMSYILCQRAPLWVLGIELIDVRICFDYPCTSWQ